MTDREYWQTRAAQAIENGQHLVHEWLVEYDDGEDGCVPAGYYVTGLDKNGCPIDWPVRHEYGPYEKPLDFFSEISA